VAIPTKPVLDHIGLKRVRILVWSISALLLLSLVYIYLVTTPYLDQHIPEHDRGLAVAAAFFGQDLALMLPLALLVITIVTHARTPKGLGSALRYYALTLVGVIVVESSIWWSIAAPRHIAPIVEPAGADFGAGLIAFALALLAPVAILSVELLLKLVHALRRRTNSK